MPVTRPIARLGLVGAGTALVLALSACGGPAPEAELPDVRGVALDEAEGVLEEAGFDRTVDEDHLEDRAIFMSSNWVVVEQSPAPGQKAPTDTEVVLSVAKIGDEDVVDLLPEGSPVAVELREEAAEDERHRQEQEAADAERAEQEAAEAAARAAEEATAAAADLQGYVERLDPAMRIGTQLITGISDFTGDVRSGSLDDFSFQLGADTMMQSGEALVEGLALGGPPESTGRQAEYERLEAAAEAIDRAADTLASARGATRDSSLARFDEIWAPAVAEWNAALVALYAGSTVTPPQVS